MEFHFNPLNEKDAQEIASWHYSGIYAFYDMEQDPEDLAELLNPASWVRYYGVRDESGALIGFFYFEEQGDAVEIGLGLRPDRTGRGLGQAFVEAGLAFAGEKFKPTAFCLSVAVFNRRAIRVYEQAGFRQVETYLQETNGGQYEFVHMVKTQKRQRCILLDWGNTLMRDFPEFDGPMYTWPRVEALPHVKETLAVLHPDWILSIATNAAASDEGDIRKALERADLGQWIDRIYCFRRIGHQKPSAAFFDAVLADLGLGSEQVVMVGDNFEADVLGANRCGIRAVWFNERTEEVRSGELYHTIHSFEELPDALKGWIK